MPYEYKRKKQKHKQRYKKGGHNRNKKMKGGKKIIWLGIMR